jgi:hypothetical protein
MLLRKDLMVFVFMLFAAQGLAEKMVVHTFAGGGGKSSNGQMTHFSAIGVGMAVGTASGGGIEAHHGFLAGARVFSDSDIVPPEFDPQPQNLRFAVREADCLASVVFPEYTVTDDRDLNPTVTVTIVDPLTDINPAGETVLLPPGSYDVVLTVTDRQGNETRAAIRVDVVDESEPNINPIPNPTPNDGLAIEATSPTGTPVALDVQCQDACDAEPVVLDIPAKFDFGNTDVALTCRDRSGNERTENITIRIKDTTAPQLVGQLPDSFDILCNNAGGALMQVPFVIFSDNATRPSDIAVGLVVDPGTAEAASFAQVPNTITLTAGAHTLRYVATDTENNVAVADLVVTVKDETAPRIEVAGVPDNGWFKLNDAQFEFTVVDDCGSADQLDVSVVPAPDSMVADGNTFTVGYEDDGIYNLQIAVTDLGNNTARDNSVSFGVDRTLPEHVFVTPTETQDGQSDETFSFYGMGEQVAMTFAARDAGNQASGIASAAVIVPAINLGLLEFTAEGNGRPIQGDAEVDNLRCTTNRAINGVPVCVAGKVNMKLLPPGRVDFQFEINDFAGNTAYQNVSVVNGNLGAAIRRVEQRLQGVLAPCPTCPVLAEGPEVIQLGLAINKLDKATCADGVLCLGTAEIPESDYKTLRFLGGVIQIAQSASINLMNLLNGTDDADKQLFYRTQLELLARMTVSDIELYKEWVERIDPAGQQNAAFYQENYDRDMAKLNIELVAMNEALGARNFPQVFAAGVKSFFHIKMAHELWVMNYHAQPEPQAEVDNADGRVSFNYTEYRRGRDVLEAIRSELDTYRGLSEVPALAEMNDIRVRLTTVVGDLDTLIADGINAGLTDLQYLNTLLELRSVARSSATASNQGAYVRVYQLAMMQVVRWLTHFSLATAQLFDPVEQPVYALAQASIDEGVALLDQREVASVINLYGDVEKALCPIIGVYHCWFTRDDFLADGGVDTDASFVDAIDDMPEVCIDDLGMVDPLNWDMNWRDSLRNGPHDPVQDPCAAVLP